MYHTGNVEGVGATLVDLMSFFSSPQRDDTLMREAGVTLDRALAPILVRLAMCGPLSVAGVAAEVGRDHTTVSRQLAKLEALGLIARQDDRPDRRLRTAALTVTGETVVSAITDARRRLLSKVLAGWSERDLEDLARLNRQLVDSLRTAERGERKG